MSDPGSRRARRILFIQHAGALGGSTMSLLYTMQGLDRSRYEPVVALIRPIVEMTAMYRQAGIETLEWPGITTFEHTAAKHLRIWHPLDWVDQARFASRLRTTAGRTRQLVEQLRPDLVHLNSAVLAPPARTLRSLGVPFVWHVREHPVAATLSLRTRWLQRALREWPAESIFISHADRAGWVGEGRGEVIHNFVDFSTFNSERDGVPVRNEFGIAPNAPVVLFMGGISAIKGVFPLLEALALVRREIPDVRCLMAGAAEPMSTSLPARVARRLLPLVGSGTHSQRVAGTIRRLDLEEVCIRIPFHVDTPGLLAASDLLAFPAVSPHFPRPVVEAAAMKKPVVASRLPGAVELIDDGRSGLLTTAGDPQQLAEAILRLLRDPELRIAMGGAGYTLARERHDAGRQVKRIMNIYERVLDIH
jgi:glycosyltransferase involved in cell wall biosynthesis